MKNLIRLFLVLALLFTAGAYFFTSNVNAQEMSDPSNTSEPEEIMVEEGGTDIGMEDGTIFEEDGEMTDGEVIMDKEEAMTEETNEIEGLEDLEGEIVSVTEEEVVIETIGGETLTLSLTEYEAVAPHNIEGEIIAPEVGQKIEKGTVAINLNSDDDTGPTVNTTSGSYIILDETSITRNDTVVNLSDLMDGDEVIAFLDADERLVAIELIDAEEEVEESSGSGLLTGMIIVILILLVIVFMKKRKKSPQPIMQ